MKYCPSCGELIGDTVEECFKCHYNYIYGRVITAQKRGGSEKQVQDDLEQQKTLETKKQEQIERNPKFEYKVIDISDSHSGKIETTRLQNIINEYAFAGWKLHTIFTNEIGKNALSIGYGGVKSGTNATIDQVVMVFERCIKPLEQY